METTGVDASEPPCVYLLPSVCTSTHFPRLVLPTPGAPTKHRIVLLLSLLAGVS